MAVLGERAPRNAPGDFYVDRSCIACDTCRRIAPETFGGGEDDEAFVARQPASGAEDWRARMALIACPVAAIGTVSRRAGEVAEAARLFPDPVEGIPGVYGCGYAAESSFGASSWLVVREGGNVLVDSPRFAKPLLRRIRELGGARWMFLSHRDDVADHARWANALGCQRVLHSADVSAGTADVELVLRGLEPAHLAPNLLAIPVPGHTRGLAALLFRDEVLFTGDHLWGDSDGRLEAGRSVCWFDWEEQTRSMERLLPHSFKAVLPGHGRPWRAASAEDARFAVIRLIERMRLPGHTRR